MHCLAYRSQTVAHRSTQAWHSSHVGAGDWRVMLSAYPLVLSAEHGGVLPLTLGDVDAGVILPFLGAHI
jgi:uncharacterized protein YcgI (DUF1989 family)